MGVLFIILAVALAIATFIENDYGAAAAKSMVYNTWWFEVIFVLLALNIGGQTVIFKLYRRDKLTVFLFHAAFIIMIAGAAITRYTGYEGIMHIREGASSNTFRTAEKYISLKLRDASGAVLLDDDTPFSITSVSVDKYSRKVTAHGLEGRVTLSRFIPNASEAVVDSRSGKPIVSMLVTRGMSAREVVFLTMGEVRNVAGFSIGFGAVDQCDINIAFNGTAFSMVSAGNIASSAMGSQDSDIHEAGVEIPLELMKIYTTGSTRIIPQKISPSGIVVPVPVDMAQQPTGQNALEFEISMGNSVYTTHLWDRSARSVPESEVKLGDYTLVLSYGEKTKELPFSIRLNDFTLERYPGSNSPSGYKSDVVLVDDQKGVEKPYLIFMNNILKHRGYRFFQSSYDQDEMGTVLSVNRDLAGMLVT